MGDMAIDVCTPHRLRELRYGWFREERRENESAAAAGPDRVLSGFKELLDLLRQTILNRLLFKFDPISSHFRLQLECL